jgi:hypothetical protein
MSSPARDVREWEWLCENQRTSGFAISLNRVDVLPYARIVAMSGFTPSIEIIRFRMQARTQRLISVLTI